MLPQVGHASIVPRSAYHAGKITVIRAWHSGGFEYRPADLQFLGAGLSCSMSEWSGTSAKQFHEKSYQLPAASLAPNQHGPSTSNVSI